MNVPAWFRGTLLLAMTLSAGVVVGVAYERQRAPRHQPPEMNSHHVMHRFSHELRLDSAQHKAITGILARRQHAVDSTWHTVQPHVRATLDSTLHEIMAVLRPDQVVQYKKLVEALHPGALR